MSALKIYYYLLQFSPAIPLMIGVIRYRRLSAPLRTLLLWFSLSLSLTIVMTVLSVRGINNLWLMNLSLPLYCFLLCRAFSLWEQNRMVRTVYRWIPAVFVSVWAFEILTEDRLFLFTRYSRPLLNWLFISISCMAIYDSNRRMDLTLTEQSRFWVASGVIIYYGGMMMVNAMSDVLLDESAQALQSALLVQPALSLISHVIYGIGLRQADG